MKRGLCIGCNVEGTSAPRKRNRIRYATIALFVLLGMATIVSTPSSIQYITDNNALAPLPWGDCCALKGPASELLGLGAVVFLLYVELFVSSPLSILTGFLLWKRRKIGATLGTYVSILRLGILLIAFAVPIGVIYLVQLLLVRKTRPFLD